MEIFVWLEVMPDQVELKCAIITYGGQCVMMDGVSRMLEWCADNLDYQHHVSISTSLPKSWLYRFCFICPCSTEMYYNTDPNLL